MKDIVEIMESKPHPVNPIRARREWVNKEPVQRD